MVLNTKNQIQNQTYHLNSVNEKKRVGWGQQHNGVYIYIAMNFVSSEINQSIYDKSWMKLCVFFVLNVPLTGC